MDLTGIVAVVCLVLPSIRAATVPVDQAALVKEVNALLRRCPCVPINTCYSQGENLDEQNFLNLNFECEDVTRYHCCGPYFQTLGSEDFYFDDDGFDRQGAWRKSPSLMESNFRIVLPPDPSPNSHNKGSIIFPETTSTTNTTIEDSAAASSLLVTKVEPLTDEAKTTLMDVDYSAEPVNTITATEPTTATVGTTLSPEEDLNLDLRMAQSATETTTSSTTTTTESDSETTPDDSSEITTSTTEASATTRKNPTRTSTYKKNSKHRQAMNKLRLFVKTSTTPSSTEYTEDEDEEYYDEDEETRSDNNDAAEEQDEE